MDRFCVVVILLLYASINAFTQNNDRTLGQIKIESCFDADSLKYIEVCRHDSIVIYSKYFSRKGDTISVYKWNMLHSSIEKIQKKIKANFDYNTPEVRGRAILLLIFDCEKEIFELRIIRGITKEFDNALGLAIRKTEEELIPLCPYGCKEAIVSPFPIKIY